MGNPALQREALARLADRRRLELDENGTPPIYAPVCAICSDDGQVRAQGEGTIGGGVNPTSTIQALALYIADRTKKRFGTRFDRRNNACPSLKPLTS